MDMKQPEISVIVPVYKVEPYLRQCIESILNQTFKEFELILVDDGSPDNCGTICDEYAEVDSRVVVVHQTNQGASAARNVGLDVMQGKYIAFVDSDDVINQNYLAILYRKLQQSNADISICQYTSDSAKALEKIHYDEQEAVTHILTGRQASLTRYSRPEWIHVGPVCKLVHRRLFENYRFPIGKLKEDQAVIPYIIYTANRIAIMDTELYFYRIRENSLEHSPFSVRFFDDIQHMNKFIVFLNENGEKEIVSAAKKRRELRLAMYILRAKVAGISEIPDDCKMSVFRALCVVRAHYSFDRFTWYLSKIYPWLVRPYTYFCKIESILTGNPL